jgi:DNA invertase Pin-like site-specific DNA recombinase
MYRTVDQAFAYTYGSDFTRQREAIQRYAAANGFSIEKWYQEMAVGEKTEWENRPVWSVMLHRLHPVRTIIIERLDRLATSKVMQDYIVEDLEQRNIRLISATEPHIYYDPTRVLVRQEMSTVAEYNRTMNKKARER